MTRPKLQRTEGAKDLDKIAAKVLPELEKLLVKKAAEKAGLAQVLKRQVAGKLDGPSNIPMPGKEGKREIHTFLRLDVIKKLEPDFMATEYLHIKGVQMPWGIAVDWPIKAAKSAEGKYIVEEMTAVAGEELEDFLKGARDKITLADKRVDLVVSGPQAPADKEKEAQKIAEQLIKEIAAAGEKAANQASKRCLELFEKKKKDDEELGKWYFKSITKIVGSVGGVIGSATTIAATAGLAAPAAWISATRSVITIGVEVKRLATKPDARLKEVKRELKIVRDDLYPKLSDPKIMNDPELKKKAQANTSLLEFTMIAASKLLGYPLPSVASFTEHVNDYKQDVTKLNNKVDKLLEEYHKFLDTQTKLNKTLREINLSADKRTKVEQHIDNVEKATADMPDRIAAARKVAVDASKNFKLLDDAAKALKENVSVWVDRIAPFIDLVISAPLAFGAPAEGPQGALKDAVDKMFPGLDKAQKVVDSANIVVDWVSQEMEAAGIS